MTDTIGAKMTCDNDCTRAGWQEAEIEIGYYSLHVSHNPDADLDDTFAAFCHDTQEMMRINGWLIEEYHPISV